MGVGVGAGASAPQQVWSSMPLPDVAVSATTGLPARSGPRQRRFSQPLATPFPRSTSPLSTTCLASSWSTQCGQDPPGRRGAPHPGDGDSPLDPRTDSESLTSAEDLHMQRLTQARREMLSGGSHGGDPPGALLGSGGSWHTSAPTPGGGGGGGYAEGGDGGLRPLAYRTYGSRRRHSAMAGMLRLGSSGSDVLLTGMLDTVAGGSEPQHAAHAVHAVQAVPIRIRARHENLISLVAAPPDQVCLLIRCAFIHRCTCTCCVGLQVIDPSVCLLSKPLESKYMPLRLPSSLPCPLFAADPPPVRNRPIPVRCLPVLGGGRRAPPLSSRLRPVQEAQPHLGTGPTRGEAGQVWRCGGVEVPT